MRGWYDGVENASVRVSMGQKSKGTVSARKSKRRTVNTLAQ